MLQVRNSVLALGVAFVTLSGVSVAQGGPRAWWVDDNCTPPTTGSCDDPFCTINEANLAASATEVDTIWVRPGTYTDPSDGQIKITRRVKLRSTDGPATTTIRAEVLFGTTGQGPETLLEGFTVTNPAGTGIWCNAKSPEIRGNVITGCTNSGIILSNSESLLIDNVISNNSTQLSGGGIVVGPTQETQVVRIVDCQIVGNTAYNSGGGILADGKGQLWLVNTVIRGNQATSVSGGGAYFSGIEGLGGAGGGTDPCSVAKLKVFMQNCLITCNLSSSLANGQGGGGVYFSTLSEGYLSNCTFSQNSAARRGGALYAGGTCVKAYNSIFWHDTAALGGPEIANDSANLTIAYNVLEGGCAGVHLNFPYAFSCSNAINENPQFLSSPACPGEGDYRLNRDLASKAVDSGDNTKVLVDFVDVDRNGIIEPRTPRDLPDQAHFASHAARDRFVDDTMTNNTGVPDPGPPAYPDIVDMGAYETARCTTDANCEDPSSCYGNASCVSTWCDISWMADCNANLKEDFCDMVENNCNNNALPDDCEVCGGPFPAKLIDDDAEYPCDGSLPRIRRQVLRLTFACDITGPNSGQVQVRQILAGQGNFGADLTSNFTFTAETDRVLKIVEIDHPFPNLSVLNNATWYAIRNGTWPCVEPFEVTYAAVRGDADNTLVTDNADMSYIFANQTGAADDDDRSDINVDTFVDFADISDAYAYIGSTAPTKPTGHTCTVPP